MKSIISKVLILKPLRRNIKIIRVGVITLKNNMYVKRKRKYFNNEKKHMYYIYKDDRSIKKIDEYFGKYTNAYIYALCKYDKFDIREITNYDESKLQNKTGSF
jgi:hypothetical protein